VNASTSTEPLPTLDAQALARAKKAQLLAERKRKYLNTLANNPNDFKAALRSIDRQPGWRERWRAADADFKYQEDQILGRMERDVVEVPDFRTFRARYFGERGVTWPHMQSWIDLYEDPRVRRSIVVGPPNHARTTVMNVQRYTHMAALEAYLVKTGMPPREPMRAAVVSANGDLAEVIGWQINQYLTDRFFSGDLIAEYGPFRPPFKGRWSASEMYFAWRGAEEKDPSLQFLGWNESLQSARLTDATFDDADNPLYGAADRRKLQRFLDQVAIPRLDPEIGRLWYLCNRVDHADVAAEILARAEDGTWHAVVQPALSRCARADYPTHPVDCEDCGKPLWPERIGLDHIRDARKQLRNERLFALVYLAESTGEGTTFPQTAIARSFDSRRTIGEKPDTARPICTLDPAAVEGAAVMAVGFEPTTQRRYLLDCDWGTGRGSAGLKAWIRDYVRRFHPVAFGIEAQGGFALFGDDEDLKRFLEDEDCTLYALETGRNKNDPEYGVSSLVGLFDSMEGPLLSIPWGDLTAQSKMQPLIDQLQGYVPGGIGAYDLVMCLWFAERVIRQHSSFARRKPARKTNDPMARWRRHT